MTGITIILSIVVFILLFWFYLYIKATLYSVFTRFRHFSAQQGVPAKATVTDVNVLSERGKFPLLECEFEFPNFSGELIREKWKFGDSMPSLKRYEVGKKVEVFLNKNSKTKSPLSFKGANVEIKWKVTAFYVFLGLVYLAFCYYLMQWAIAKIWTDIPGHEETLNNAGIQGMLIGFGILLFNFFLFRAFGIVRSKKKRGSARDLRYHGLKAVGKITKYEDTGTMINDNPVVRFHYSFKDKNGLIHQGNDKLTIGKLDIGLIPTISEKTIFYLPDDPKVSMLEEYIANSSGKGCASVQSILLFVVFVFSVVIVVTFVLSVYSFQDKVQDKVIVHRPEHSEIHKH